MIMKRDEHHVKQVFDRSFPVASTEQTESACERVLQRLNSLPEDRLEILPALAPAVRPKPAWHFAVIGASAVFALAALLAIPFIRGLVWPPRVYATILDGAVDQADGGKTLRTNGAAGAVVALPDSSRVEMRSESELSLERAEDGLRIRLRGTG
jgi:ferric-dicitrate binding protein FerR (iron transport regulator)